MQGSAVHGRRKLRNLIRASFAVGSLLSPTFLGCDGGNASGPDDQEVNLEGLGQNPVTRRVSPGRGTTIQLSNGATLTVGPQDAQVDALITLADATTPLAPSSPAVEGIGPSILVRVEALQPSSGLIPSQEETLTFTLTLPDDGLGSDIAFINPRTAQSTITWYGEAQRTGSGLTATFRRVGSGAVSYLVTRAARRLGINCPYSLDPVSTALSSAPDPLNLIYVHGWDPWQPPVGTGCETRDFDGMHSYLFGNEVSRAYNTWLYTYPTDLALEVAAQRLAEEIERRGLNNVVIVAHSMGGTVATYMLRFSAPSLRDRIFRVVTLGSPIRGTPLATQHAAVDLLQACIRLALTSSEFCRHLQFLEILSAGVVSPFLVSPGMLQLSPGSSVIQGLRDFDDSRLIHLAGNISNNPAAEELKYRLLHDLVVLLVRGGFAPGMSVENDGMIPVSSAIGYGPENSIHTGINHTEIRTDATVHRRILSHLGRPDPPNNRLTLTLQWDTFNDVDLYLEEPSGELIYFLSRRSNSGGVLDRDSNAACNIDGINRETISYPAGAPPGGIYVFMVDLWSPCGRGGANYTVTLEQGGTRRVFTGRVTQSDPTHVYAPFSHFALESGESVRQHERRPDRPQWLIRQGKEWE